MTYLAHARPTRQLIEELIVSREAELATITTAAERQRLEGGFGVSSRRVGADRRFGTRAGDRLQPAVSDESTRKR